MTTIQITREQAVHSILLHLPVDVYQALALEARRQDRSVSAQLRRILTERYTGNPSTITPEGGQR